MTSLRRLVVTAGLCAAILVSGVGPAHAAGETPVGDASSDGALLAPSDEAGDSDLVSFGIAPAGREEPDDRPFVAVTAAPGSVIYEHVAIINQDDVPIDLDVYPGDVRNVEGGGLGVTTRDEPAYEGGMWLTLDGPPTVTVPAQTAEDGFGYVIVPVTITIPEDAEPGDHVAGLVASLTAAGSGSANAAPNLDLEQRVAARIYIHVDGDLRPGLVVRDLGATWTRTNALGVGTATVRYALENTGNVSFAVDSQVTISGPFGLKHVTRAGDRVDLLLPGGSTELTTTFEGLWPLVREEVTVAANAVAAPAGADPGIGTVTVQATFFAFPWLAFGVLVLLVGVIVWHMLVRRAKRKRRGQAPPGSRRARRDGRSGPAPQGLTESTPAGGELTGTHA